MDRVTDDSAIGLDSLSVRRSGRKKVQRSLYGHEDQSPIVSSSQNSEQEHPEETSKKKETSSDDFAEDGSDSDSMPLSFHVSPGKGKKRSGKSSKKLPSAKKPRTSKRTSFEKSEGHGTIFDIIKAGKGALQTVVDDWIESYNQDQNAAMIDLIQFIIQCCGCKGEVTGEMLEEDENVNAIRKLTEEFEEESHEYPLTMPGQVYKKFKTNFCEFIDCLVQQCQYSIVYDEFMMDKLISWLISLSDSQVRAFRHTSTLAGMKLVDALIKIAVKVNVESDNTKRQLESEKQKTASKRGDQKMEMLQNKMEELDENKKILEEFMNYIFQGVFVHRYRDIRPEIRSLCISEIGTWMKEYSEYFLSHQYLKYVVWTLHDKVGDVRINALQTLIKLYEVEEFLGQLEPLTSRFKGRIVSMTLDKEHDVIVEAIRLVSLLYRYEELNEEDCQQVEQLVFCSNRQVAHEAGSFLHERLLAEAESNSPTKKRASKKSEFQKKCEYMKRLIDFLTCSQIHNHSAYLVDSIWGYCEYLKDWKVMTSMLLEDTSNGDLTDEEETALIEIMTCCCRQATLGHGPPGRVLKRLLSSKEKKTVVNDQQEMSAHFMEKIPALLGKYGTDLPKAENLITIPQYFDLEEYVQRQLGKHLEDLLDQIDDLVQKGPETPLLEECAKTYRILTENELTLRSKAEVARNKLMDNVVELFKEGCKNVTANKDERNEEEFKTDVYAVEVNLKRIAAFYKSHDLGPWDLYESLNSIANSNDISDEVISLALLSLTLLLTWSLHALDSNHPNKREMKTIKQRLSSVMELHNESIHFRSEEIQKQAFSCVCDLLTIYSPSIKYSCPLLSPLAYVANNQLLINSKDFIIRYVFSDLSEDEENEDEDNTENEVEELNSKRVALAGFCKLIVHGQFDMSSAGEIFARLITGFGNFGDIIKHTMSKLKETNRNGYTKVLSTTLTNTFRRYRDSLDGGPIDTSSADFIGIKDLARRFSLTFGIDPNKPNVRTSLLTLHREAIVFSLGKNENSDKPFPNLVFLDIINECTFKLIPQDKKVVLKYLDDQTRTAKIDLSDAGKHLEPFRAYHTNLSEGAQVTHGRNDKASRARPLAQKAKRKLIVEDEENDREIPPNKNDLQNVNEEEEDDDGETTPKASVKSKNKATKKLGQKNAKRKREDAELDDNADEEADDDEEEEEDDDEETTPKASEKSKNKATEKLGQKNAKRKREDAELDDNADEEAELDSEDEFQESNSIKPASQRSWVSSQPKRSMPEISATYGKTKANTSKRTSVKETLEEEDEGMEEEVNQEDNEEKSNESASPKSKPPPSKRTRKEFPEDIFHESPAQDSKSDDDDLDEAF